MYDVGAAMLDNVYRWNFRTVLRNMHEAEIISLFLPYLGKALIVDLRHNGAEGPIITTDGLVSGPQERVEHLKQLRPHLELPSNITLAPWLGPVRSLQTSGALAEVANRLERLGYPQAKDDLGHAYQELLTLERNEIASLIRGDAERTKTLYQR